MIAFHGFSQESGDPSARDNPISRPGSGKDSHGEDHHDWRTDIDLGEMGILGYLAGVDVIHEKYQIKIQRIFLDAKEQTLNYREEQRVLLTKLVELSGGYENDQIRFKKEIIGILQKLRSNWSNIDAIHKTSMDKIKALHQEQKKEIEKALDDEMKKLGADDDEMNKFVGIMKQWQPNSRPFIGEPEMRK
jgi:hypothetical protein